MSRDPARRFCRWLSADLPPGDSQDIVYVTKTAVVNVYPLRSGAPSRARGGPLVRFHEWMLNSQAPVTRAVVRESVIARTGKTLVKHAKIDS